MNFLEARRIVAGFEGGESLRFLFATSGTTEQLLLYMRAHAALRGRQAELKLLPFNTLAQTLRMPPEPGQREVFLLLPWDFLPELDWRSGIPASLPSVTELRDRASAVAGQLAARPGARLLYIPAPVQPLITHPAENASLLAWLNSLAASIGATLLGPETFSLATYFASGCPVASPALGAVAEAVVDAAHTAKQETAKVLVTDLDNVLWAGVVAEDGLGGISYLAEGKGYRHFIYQTFLAKLKREGILLAAVSRNDPEVALAPLGSGRMVLGQEDFITVLASYSAKSAQIRDLAAELNLGLDSFVFVDDNPVELAEVSAGLPQVRCVPFPVRDDQLPAFLAELVRLFTRDAVTTEDSERTEMYRRRLAGMTPSSASGTDLTGFLRDLTMTLTVHDRSRDDQTRVVQLINKTNQFNLNGCRVTDEEVGRIIADGGRLYGASLEDRHGSHGETLACLITRDGEIASFVMSCRVFQRRLEYAFLAWLSSQENPPSRLRFGPTDRNAPVRDFLSDPAFSGEANSGIRFDPARFARDHRHDLELFTLKAPSVSVPVPGKILAGPP